MDSRSGRVSDGRTRGQTAATDTTTIAIATSAAPPNAQAGQPQWYKDLWSGIGLGRADGTSKYSYFIWRNLF